MDPIIQRGDLTRRTFLAEGAGAVVAATAASRLARRTRRWWRPAIDLTQPRSSQLEALRVLGRRTMRLPDSLPNPRLAAGTDTIPQIEHVVVLMLENHSYDNLLGMLGREPGQRPRGDGFGLARDGLPSATNPYPDGSLQRAFRMPTTCQFHSTPSQEWEASHNAFDDGRNDGFVRTQISPGTNQIVGAVAMGYWTEEDLPFTYGLAKSFPIGDRWFCSCLAQTDPNRRYLIAATSSGMTDDIGTSPGNTVANSTLGVPAANGTIFQRLSDAGISWADYAVVSTTGATMNLYPPNDSVYEETNIKPFEQFFADAKAGTLPSFSLLDPDYGTQSQENPQNMVVGEGLLARVVNALVTSPKWRQSILVFTYDEHGGYYDHVPPPVALAPDSIPPAVNPGESTYDGFARYGFRVPAIVVSPYAKRDHVSHIVYDHTSILAFLERKWNLPAMTYRDANANDLTDFLDLSSMKAGTPTFPELPPLPAPGDDPARLACSRTGPGKVPAPIPAQRLLIRAAHIRIKLHEVVVELRTDRGSMNGIELELLRGHHVVARHHLGSVGYRIRRITFRLGRTKFRRGHYTLLARQDHRTLARRTLVIR